MLCFVLRGNPGKKFCATAKLADFSRFFLDNLKLRVYTNSAFRVNKESKKHRKRHLWQIYNRSHAIWNKSEVGCFV